jgi:hypothetical protein
MEPHFILHDFDGALGRFKAGTIADFSPSSAAALRPAGFITAVNSDKHKAYLTLHQEPLETKPALPPELQTKPGITRPTRKKGEIING